MLLHDNALAHMARVAQAVVKDIGFEHLSHAPYSLDLAPSDFYLFHYLNKHLRGTRFYDDNEIKQASESYMDSMPQEFYLTGIKEASRSFLTDVANVLLLRPIMLRNNI